MSDYYPHDFHRVGRELYCEDVSLAALAREVGTPLYVYSFETLTGHLRKLQSAFRAQKPLICFSVKANGNLSILKLLVQRGAGLDIVSGGELYKALKVGCPPSRIVYASVGKSDGEIREALRAKIFCFNVESRAELEAINAMARRMKTRARVALRINPDVDAHTHQHITTGKAESKFGIDPETALTIFRDRRWFTGIDLIGLHLHIGSQITQSTPFLEAIDRASAVLARGRAAGAALEWLNLGGGLGIIYKDEQPQTPEAFAKAIGPKLAKLKVRLILEPGRFIVGNAGALVTEVLYVKVSRGKRFAVVDAGMNDLIRPALYGAYHQVMPVAASAESNGAPTYDIVGPICESADVFARDRKLAELSNGSLLAILGAGAYGSTMASNYNGRVRPAEVLVRGKRWAVIRTRETRSDLIRHDVVPKALIA